MELNELTWTMRTDGEGYAPGTVGLAAATFDNYIYAFGGTLGGEARRVVQ